MNRFANLKSKQHLQSSKVSQAKSGKTEEVKTDADERFRSADSIEQKKHDHSTRYPPASSVPPLLGGSKVDMLADIRKLAIVGIVVIGGFILFREMSKTVQMDKIMSNLERYGKDVNKLF